MLFEIKPMPRETLPLLENALLWTMRAWAIGHAHNRDTGGLIVDVFDKLGVPGCARHLDGLMTVLSLGATRHLEVNCVCYSEVSEDEAMLLEVFALQQQEHHEAAYELLSEITTEAAAALGCDSANRLAHLLREAGLGLSPDLHDRVRGRILSCGPVSRAASSTLH